MEFKLSQNGGTAAGKNYDQAAGLHPPDIKPRGFLPDIVLGLLSLLKGMKVTFYYLSHPSTVVTRQYPENRATLKMYERFRAQLVMPHNEQGFHKCTACRMCERACPNASIKITSRKGALSGKTEIDHYVWRLDSCTFCNACVIACPFGALAMSGDFENAVYDRNLLVYNLNRYAGPPSSVLEKIADPTERRKLIEPRSVYSGPVLLRSAEPVPPTATAPAMAESLVP